MSKVMNLRLLEPGTKIGLSHDPTIQEVYKRSAPPTKHAEGARSAMTTRVATRKIDVDTHFYPPVDYKALCESLPRGLVAQAQDMLVRDAIDHQPRYPMLGMERMRRLHIGT